MQLGYQFMRFSLVGVIGTAGHYTTLLLLVNLCRISPVVASALGSVAGALINYSLNYRFTFRSQAAHGVSLLKFMLVALVGALVNLGTMWVGVNVLQMDYIIVQLVGTSLVLVLGFVLNRAWIFHTTAKS